MFDTSEEAEDTSSFVVSNINTCLKKIFPNISETYDIKSVRYKLDEDDELEITKENDLMIVEHGSFSFDAAPEIEIKTGELAGPVVFSVIGKSKTPKMRANESSTAYTVNMDEIVDLISEAQLKKEQEKLILTKVMEHPSSNVISSLEFTSLFEEMFSRFKINL